MGIYLGYREVTNELVNSISTGQMLPNTHEYLVHGEKVYRFDGQNIVPIQYTKLEKFSPKNIHQKMLFDLLDNDDIPVKVAVGIAGSGKTKAALKYGLHKVKNGDFQRLFIVKQPAPVGEEVGYLKGDKADKVRNWMGSIYDNLDGGELEAEQLVRYDRIEFDIVAHMQGRDITNSFILVDEAQLLTDEQVKMLGSRVSDGSVIVFCGDYEQIFNRKYKKDNGLISMVNQFAGNELVGIVTLSESVRSNVAALFASMKTGGNVA